MNRLARNAQFAHEFSYRIHRCGGVLTFVFNGGSAMVRELLSSKHVTQRI